MTGIYPRPRLTSYDSRLALSRLDSLSWVRCALGARKEPGLESRVSDLSLSRIPDDRLALYSLLERVRPIDHEHCPRVIDPIA